MFYVEEAKKKNKSGNWNNPVHKAWVGFKIASEVICELTHASKWFYEKKKNVINISGMKQKKCAPKELKYKELGHWGATQKNVNFVNAFRVEHTVYILKNLFHMKYCASVAAFVQNKSPTNHIR